MADEHEHRIISREFPDGRRIIASIDGSANPDEDEALLDKIEADMDQRRLRAVDDPE